MPRNTVCIVEKFKGIVNFFKQTHAIDSLVQGWET